MYDKDKRSFFERLTGTMNIDEEMENKEEAPKTTEETQNIDVDRQEEVEQPTHLKEKSEEDRVRDELFVEEGEKEENEQKTVNKKITSDEEIYKSTPETPPLSTQDEEGELAVDVYEDETHIYIQAMIAGVEPDDVDVSITRDMITMRGNRINPVNIPNENYYHTELYWGGFSRKILLPEEIDPEKSKAMEKHGLLVLKLPKLNKKQSQKLEVESVE